MLLEFFKANFAAVVLNILVVAVLTANYFDQSSRRRYMRQYDRNRH